MEDVEYTLQVREVSGGRKRKTQQGAAQVPTKYSIDGTGDPDIACTHGLDNPSKLGNAQHLCGADMSSFKRRLYSHKSKVEQDKFLLKYMRINQPGKNTILACNRQQKRDFTIRYYIERENKKVVKVCAKTFQKVTGTQRLRLLRIARSYHYTGEMPKEKRGGRRNPGKDEEMTDLIKNDIKQYKCRESHYSRATCQRSYLPPELNLRKLWQRFDSGRKSDHQVSCSLSKYKSVFYKHFNLGFGNPHQDTCSTCKHLLIKIKLQNDLNEKNKIRTEYRLHVMRAKKFFQTLNEVRPDTVKVCFDIQQNQPLPKLSIGEVFYSRQVWLYNLCIMIHTDDRKQDKDNILFYTWLETEAGRGANEVSSALHHFLKNIENKLVSEGKFKQTLELYSDSCSSQNKNSILLGVMTYFMETSRVFESAIHYYPIRGHSYMPPDRVFGRVEREYRKRETMVSPMDYYGILKNHGQLLRWGNDWFSFDFKTLAKDTIIKKQLPFKVTHARVLTYKKVKQNKVKVFFSDTYSGAQVEADILKKGKKNAQDFRHAKKLEKENKVSIKKKIDVEKLLAFCHIDLAAQTFYDDVLRGDAKGDEDNTRRDYDESEPFL